MAVAAGALLESQGAAHVCDSSSPTFMEDLTQALQPEEIAVYGQRATGTKYLINPGKGVAN